jgi:hypothetical protein
MAGVGCDVGIVVLHVVVSLVSPGEHLVLGFAYHAA